MLTRGAFAGLLSAALGLACPSAHAFDPLDVYFGAAVGRAGVRVNQAQLVDNVTSVAVSSPPFSFTQHDTGWKLQLGVRPISLLGAEIEYVDFGKTTTSNAGGSILNYVAYQANSSAKAVSAFGVAYAPIGLPLLDIYGKAGIARLQTTTSIKGSFGCLSNCPTLPGAFGRSVSEARFAYAFGTQLNLGHLAARVEYERISASTGDPDLFSIGAIWTF